MNKRLVQLALVALMGAFLAWWLLRDDEPEPATPPTVARPAPSSPDAGAADPAPAGAPQTHRRPFSWSITVPAFFAIVACAPAMMSGKTMSSGGPGKVRLPA